MRSGVRRTGPMGWAWHWAVGETRLDLGHRLHQRGAVGDRLALPRGPCANLAAACATSEISVGLGVVDWRHRAFDAHLALGISNENTD